MLPIRQRGYREVAASATVAPSFVNRTEQIAAEGGFIGWAPGRPGLSQKLLLVPDSASGIG